VVDGQKPSALEMELKRDEERKIFEQFNLKDEAKMRKIISEGKKEEDEAAKPKEEEEEFSLEQMILDNKEMQVSIDTLYERIKKVEVYAPGSPKHVDLMKNYLDRMDEKIMKGLENNFKVSIQTINSQKETIEMLKTHVDKLEELNQRYKFYISVLSSTLRGGAHVTTKTPPSA
jgi:IS30 family transposase